MVKRKVGSGVNRHLSQWRKTSEATSSADFTATRYTQTGCSNTCGIDSRTCRNGKARPRSVHRRLVQWKHSETAQPCHWQSYQENVRAYFLAQRIMLDKASRFTDMARLVTSTDPLIDESSRRSTSTFGAMDQSNAAADKSSLVVKDIATKADLSSFPRWRLF